MLAGIVTETDVLAALFEDRCTMETVVAEVMCRQVSTVSVFDEAHHLAQVFMRGEVALVVDEAGKLVTLQQGRLDRAPARQRREEQPRRSMTARTTRGQAMVASALTSAQRPPSAAGTILPQLTDSL